MRLDRVRKKEGQRNEERDCKGVGCREKYIREREKTP